MSSFPFPSPGRGVRRENDADLSFSTPPIGQERRVGICGLQEEERRVGAHGLQEGRRVRAQGRQGVCARNGQGWTMAVKLGNGRMRKVDASVDGGRKENLMSREEQCAATGPVNDRKVGRLEGRLG